MDKRNMKKILPALLLLTGVALVSCSEEAVPGSSAGSVPTSFEEHTTEEVEAYMDGLKETSEASHLYIHYLRYDNSPGSYAPYDIWVWPYAPAAGEGYRFNWVGRTTDDSSPTREASGNATTDSFGGAYIDVDLTANYDAGWDATSKVMGGTPMSFLTGGELPTRIGFQVVVSESRTSESGFWRNDGGNVYVDLELCALEGDKGTSYHVFAQQDNTFFWTNQPAATITDPFASDDGTNVTYGDSSYDNVDWNNEAAITATSPKFLKGTGATGNLGNGAGIGYQIMVSSFADSDGDGMGDIYGITQKLDYLSELGVEVLWLTPIQKSDSYHGYDISDYTLVDEKFGSSLSPNANNGAVSEESAMADYEDLLDAAHEKGMAVIMDLVINHTSTSNAWFFSSAQLDDDYRGYYQWGSHETQDGIDEDHFWYPYGDHPYSYYAKFGSSMPELNYSYLGTRDAVVTMAKEWLAKGVDGFRMDAVKHIFLDDEVSMASGDTIILDNSESGNYSSNLTKNLHFWRDIASRVKSEYPDAFFVGENFDGHAYHVAPYYEGFDSLFDFYSYFNFASSAANGLNSSIGGPVQSWNGYQSGSAYSTSSEMTTNINAATGLYGSASAMTYTGNWNLKSVLDTNESYRRGSRSSSTSEFTHLDGSFTSNHDIARMVNRVAGTGDASGIQAQGNLTSTNYERYLKSATCAEIAIICNPGLSWVYYGDELGMTGNFKSGQTSTSSYADLAYRQPMKWTDDGVVGDGSFTAGYSITGSGTGVELDEINSSSLVPSVASAEGNAHYEAIKAFMNAKAEIPALQRGSYNAYDWKVNNSPVGYVHNVVRTLGSESYNLIVNFSGSVTLEARLEGTIVASYNGATLTSIPPQSAILIKL